MPLHASVFEIVVVRPHREIQVERQREHINVVRITLTDAALGFGQMVLVLGAFDDGEGKRRQRQQQGVRAKALLLGERAEVLENLVVGGCWREDLLDLVVAKDQPRVRR